MSSLNESDRYRFDNAVDLLSERLKALNLSDVRVAPKQKEESENGGEHKYFAKWHKFEMSIWIDDWFVEPEWSFWVGLYTAKEKDLQTLISKLPKQLAPKFILTSSNSIKKRGKWIAKDDWPLEQYGLELYGSDGCWYGYYQKKDDFSVEDALTFFQVIHDAVSETFAADVGDLIGKIAQNKKRLIDARVGHGKYKADLIELWGPKCVVTGCEVTEALRASHIKPWRSSNNREKLDKYNGLILVPNLDALFDKFRITFQEDGSIKVSKSLTPADCDVLGVTTKMRLYGLNKNQKEYLKGHELEFEKRERLLAKRK